MTNSSRHAKLFLLQISHFVEFSRIKKRVINGSDVSQLAYGVGNQSNLASMLTMGMPTCMKNLWSFQVCTKIDHFEQRVFG